jgi:hypothetical protein
VVRIFSFYVIRLIKTRRMRWAGIVTHMREIRNACKFQSEAPKGRENLEDPDVDEWLILNLS